VLVQGVNNPTEGSVQSGFFLVEAHEARVNKRTISSIVFFIIKSYHSYLSLPSP
jgi:hypothetical protein